MKIYKPREVAKLLNVTTTTLRNWEKLGSLIAFRTPTDRRYYTQEQLNEFRNIKTKSEKIVIGYCRVSSKKQEDDLERQIDNMKTYLLAKGHPFEIITDIGSGINYNKKGLNLIIEKIVNNEVERVVVLYKDRLVRFGYELIENIGKLFGTSIEVIDSTVKTQEQELVEDMIQIITVFSARLQGKRSKKTKELLSELKNVAN